MKIVKIVFYQTLLVCFLMNCVIAINELVNYIRMGEWFSLQGELPVTLIAVSFLTALPSLLLNVEKASIVFCANALG